MQANTQKNIMNLSNAKALRRAREILKVTRSELARRVNLSPKAIEKYENGRAIIDDEKIDKILNALDLRKEEFRKIKRGKKAGLIKRKKNVITNNDRRSYQRNITKECRVLKSLRKTKGITQDNASYLCGYSRPTIGHIENGRIELSKNRIEHILKCYGFKYSDFESNLGKEAQRDEIVDSCINKIHLLDDTKLEIVKNLLGSL